MKDIILKKTVKVYHPSVTTLNKVTKIIDDSKRMSDTENPLATIRLKPEIIEKILVGIIDLQNISTIANWTGLTTKVTRKYRDWLIEKINWDKYKIDAYVVDIREVYGLITWHFQN